ncbi:MAG: sugar ABC transporter permease [Candidatus Symbiobacter sp.]|nr:sugar ABC transporter permease [Candidatus Symbiobacter sp.]
MSKKFILAFLAPSLILYIAFMVVPTLFAFRLSAYDSSGFGKETFIGLGNYLALAQDPIFLHSLYNLLLILVIGGVVVFGLAFLFSISLNSGIWGKKLFRALIFVPNVIAVVAIATFWSFLFTPRYGLWSSFFTFLHMPTIAAMLWTTPDHVFGAMMVGFVWIVTGFYTILILAGADKIPTDLIEAARLEGASEWQIFRLITLPMIADVCLITLSLWTSNAIRLFEFPYAFGGPNIDPALYTPAIHLYIMGFGQRDPVFRLGYATANGVILFLLTAALVLVVRRLTTKLRVEY